MPLEVIVFGSQDVNLSFNQYCVIDTVVQLFFYDIQLVEKNVIEDSCRYRLNEGDDVELLQDHDHGIRFF